jgi:uncharacterized protein
MSQRADHSSYLIYSPGTQVVSLKPIFGPSNIIVHPAGAVGIVISSPGDRDHDYRVRFVDGYEGMVHHDQLALLAEYKLGEINQANPKRSAGGLFDRVIYRCVVGSRAFGLQTCESDTDLRGVYLPPAQSHWSLYGVPEQLENEATQETYWELQKFLVMALKGNPNILECLYSPLVEFASPLALELLELRSVFLSKLVYQTYNGYVLSQFKRIQADLRNQGKIKPKHTMHLIRLLLSGIQVLREGIVPVDVCEHRESLLAIKRDEMPWPEIEVWRLKLHDEFRRAFEGTNLPDRPDYDRVNQFLIRARGLATKENLP